MQTTTTPPTAAAPRKSRRRWYILGFLLLLAATPVGFYLIAGWLGEREMAQLIAEIDADDPGWRWADLVAANEPAVGRENSVDQIIKVHTLANRPAIFNPGPKWDNANLILDARLTDEQAGAVEAAFARCDPALRDQARRLKDLPYGRFPILADGYKFASDFSEIQKSRTVIYVLQADAALRAHDGDLDGAAESCQAILNTAAAFQGYPTLGGCLVRVAEQATAINAIERTLGQGTVSEPQLKKLQEMLQREADTDGLVQAVRGSRAAAHQMYANIRDGKTAISQTWGNGGNPSTEPGLSGRFLDAFPNVILRYYPDHLRTMNAAVGAFKMEPTKRSAELQDIERKIRSEGNLLSRMTMPALVKVSEASLRSQAFLRCTIVAVAAERHRLSKGGWPRSLDDLVKAGLLTKIPDDPYDGKPLRLKRTPTGVIVYSVGRDRTDNGGNLDRVNLMADGVDFGFELWDPKLRGVAPPLEAP